MRCRALASPARRGTVVCHVEDDLLTSSSCFPYFMVVALESGSLLKAILLLALYPLLSLLSEETKIEVMSLISFCGVSVSSHHLGISVLPKHLLDNVGSNGFKILMAGKKKVCISRMPKLMVEEFLRKYLKVDVVLAREMKVVGGYYTGVMEEKGNEGEILVERELAGNDYELFGVSEESKTPLHPFFSRCQVLSIPLSLSTFYFLFSFSSNQFPSPMVNSLPQFSVFLSPSPSLSLTRSLTLVPTSQPVFFSFSYD